MALIRSHHLHLQWKFKLLAGAFTWGNESKHCWVRSKSFLDFKSLLTTPSNVLPLHLKQTFPPIIWIFTEGEGIESRLPFKIFSTLQKSYFSQFADIARQMIESAPGNQTDVILGGGMLSFKNGSNSNPKWVCSRQDGRDLIKGYKIDYFNLRIFNF